MRKLSAFNFISLNGYYKGPGGDTGWHRHGAEEGEYSIEMLSRDNILLFGRVTYEMMVSYWTAQFALDNDPVVAAAMTKAEKIVFSKTMREPGWNNARVIRDDIANEIRSMKQLPGRDLAILGSGTIVSQFAEQGLIDEYQIMIDPVAIGEGTPLLHGIGRNLELRLTDTRIFKSGTVLLCYRPA